MNRLVIITGGSRGIGAETARVLSRAGFSVALIYNSSVEPAKRVQSEIQLFGGVCEIFKADVSVSGDVKRVYAEIVGKCGKPFALVNCAGVAQQCLFTDITDEMWRKMIDTDLTGTFYFCREVLPDMIHEKRGKIVNIASMWGEVGASLEVHYSAAKAGVIGMTKALAKELGPSGITVNCIAPGVITTEMNGHLDGDTLSALRDETPVMRLGTPEDVAESVSYFASQAAGFVTGQVLSVDGGITL